MMSIDRDLNALTCPPIDALNQASRHQQSLPADPSAEARQRVTGPRCCIRVDASVSRASRTRSLSTRCSTDAPMASLSRCAQRSARGAKGCRRIGFALEALWKPQPPGFDPQPPAEPTPRAGSTCGDPPPTCSRPPSRALCKQEVTGSIPVGSIGSLGNRQSASQQKVNI